MATKKNVQIIHISAPLPDIVRVAPYVRVSSLSDDQLHSFHLQYSHYHSLVTNTKGWLLVDVYADGPVKIGLNQKTLAIHGVALNWSCFYSE